MTANRQTGMRVITLSNQKGGSGKTTTAVCLAAALAERQRRVLVVDLDAQANATKWLGTDPRALGPQDGTFGVLTSSTSLAGTIRETASGVDLAPASPYLVGAEKALASDPAPQFILRSALEQLRRERSYDYVLVDCPGALGTVTVGALTAADGVLVPVPAQVLSLEGLAQLLQTIQTVRDRLNPSLVIAGILICRFDARTRLASDVAEAIRQRFAGETLQTVIRENVKLAEAPGFAQPITQYAPQSAGAEDYRTLAGEIEARNA